MTSCARTARTTKLITSKANEAQIPCNKCENEKRERPAKHGVIAVRLAERTFALAAEFPLSGLIFAPHGLRDLRNRRRDADPKPEWTRRVAAYIRAELARERLYEA